MLGSSGAATFFLLVLFGILAPRQQGIPHTQNSGQAHSASSSSGISCFFLLIVTPHKSAVSSKIRLHKILHTLLENVDPVSLEHPNLNHYRLWRSVKYEEVYPNDYDTPDDVYHGMHRYFEFYNHQRPHQALDYRTPAEVRQGHRPVTKT
ncbi:MAG TPA: integrase core domain-containing protein [Candidatus Competibacteraceae bacterium]|nr:integrase core domain-containing protein [Candidatus Competibacteraceae bacterium]